MRSNKLINGIAVVALGWGLTACDQDFAGLNENPNAPEDVSAEFILPQAIQTATDHILGAGMLNLEGMGLFAQHYAKIQYPSEDRYELRPASINNSWSSFYSVTLKDIQTVIDKGEETGTDNHVAVGLILKSWVFSVMTDLWGDIPYSEALRLGKEDGTTTPAYDSQQDIYAALLSELERATGLLDADAPGFGAEDLLYGGDMDAWKKFANSLRMRLAMRIADANGTLAQQHYDAALAGGVFTDNEEMAVLNYTQSNPNQHPLYENAIGRDDHAVSKTLVDMMQGLNDPRLAIYAEPNDSTGEYIGMPNGMNDGHSYKLNTISRIGDYWRGTPNAPAVILSYAEVLFLQAEAAQRTWGGNAAALYEAGIRASLEQYGITGTDADAYVAEPGVAWAGAGSEFQQIATQKWLALFGNGMEAYSEVRRTGFPVLMPGPFAEDVNNGAIPVRIPYPATEQTQNGAALQAAIDAQGGGNDFSTPMWWMN